MTMVSPSTVSPAMCGGTLKPLIIGGERIRRTIQANGYSDVAVEAVDPVQPFVAQHERGGCEGICPGERRPDDGHRGKRDGGFVRARVPEVPAPCCRAGRGDRALVDIERGTDPAVVVWVDDADAPPAVRRRPPRDHDVATDGDVPVTQPGAAQPARGALGGPALHEPRRIDRSSEAVRPDVERAPACLLQPCAVVEHLDHLRADVADLELVAV